MKETAASSEPIFLISTAPTKWFETMISADRKCEAPDSSNAALVIPIHNEENHIESVLGMICLNKAPINRIILVTNGCTDSTLEKIQSWLQFSPKQVAKDYPLLEIDPSISSATSVSAFGIEWSIINTTQPGKANAITLAAQLAIAEQYQWLINIDANNYLEPDALGILTQHLATAESRVAVVNGAAKTIRPRKTIKNHIRDFIKGKSPLREYIHQPKGVEILGNLHAINLSWFQSIQRVPNTVTEDFSLAILAHSQGMQIEHIEGSYSWGFSPIGVSDRVRTYARYTQGFLQTAQMFPDQQDQVRREKRLINNWPERWHAHYESLRRSPGIKKATTFENIIIEEIGRMQGIRRFRKQPHVSTWEAIRSTK